MESKDDWIVIKSDGVIMDLSEVKKKHPAIMFHLAKGKRRTTTRNNFTRKLPVIPSQTRIYTLQKFPDVSRQASPATLSMVFSYTGVT